VNDTDLCCNPKSAKNP